MKAQRPLHELSNQLVVVTFRGREQALCGQTSRDRGPILESALRSYRPLHMPTRIIVGQHGIKRGTKEMRIPDGLDVSDPNLAMVQ